MAETFSQSHTGTEILKGVSRSFYLSLRLLPSGMRDAASLGYLLARSSDTIADTASIPVSDRLTCLDAFSRAVQLGDDFAAPHELLEHCTDAEKTLMAKAQENLLWLKSLTDPELALVREVMAEIISGQRLDLERFGNATATSKMLIANDAELLDYCQRVAGSVGVFWTKLGFLSEGQMTGFLVGATTALLSNMFLGQGPWTIFQMLAWGLCGISSGILGKYFPKSNKIALIIFGFLWGYIFGWIMNLWHWLAFIHPLTIKSWLLVNASSFIVDTIHAVTNGLFMAILGNDFILILKRFKKKMNSSTKTA